MTVTDDPAVRRYLARLDTALAHVPAEQRRQIVDGVREHVAAALAESDAPTEADVRDVLERLGEPEAIAAEAGPPPVRDRWTGLLLRVGLVVGIFDLLAVSTAHVGPVELAFLSIPVLVLAALAVGLHRRAHQPA